jgi:AcrR family transcriptional regulator
MGKLIDRERRAAAKEAKEDRLERLRKEALRSFVKLPFVEVTLDAIGQRAGVKKGVGSMYFGSKEELFLLLLREQLDGWYRAVLDELGAHAARLSDARLARLLARGLAERAVVCRLLALAPIVLEQNMEIMEAYRFQRWQRDRMVEVGREIERRSRGLRPGDGLRLLLRLQLMAAASYPFADPRGSLAVNLHDPDFADFRLDVAEELEHLALESLRASHRTAGEHDQGADGPE